MLPRNQYGVRLTAEKEAEKYEDAVTAIDLCKEVISRHHPDIISSYRHHLVIRTSRHPDHPPCLPQVAEGVRIVCDFQLGKLLLYPTELQQFEQSRDVKPALDREEAQVWSLTKSGVLGVNICDCL